MVKTPDGPEKDAEVPAAESPAAGQGARPAAPAQQQRTPLEFDDSRASAAYANSCRVAATPEELIIDFGLNPQPMGMPPKAIVINHRIIINFYTAKRMLHALQLAVQRHESVFGVLETDVQKRVKPGAMGLTPPSR